MCVLSQASGRQPNMEVWQCYLSNSTILCMFSWNTLGQRTKVLCLFFYCDVRHSSPPYILAFYVSRLCILLFPWLPGQWDTALLEADSIPASAYILLYESPWSSAAAAGFNVDTVYCYPFVCTDCNCCSFPFCLVLLPVYLHTNTFESSQVTYFSASYFLPSFVYQLVSLTILPSVLRAFFFIYISIHSCLSAHPYAYFMHCFFPVLEILAPIYLPSYLIHVLVSECCMLYEVCKKVFK